MAWTKESYTLPTNTFAVCVQTVALWRTVVANSNVLTTRGEVTTTKFVLVTSPRVVIYLIDANDHTTWNRYVISRTSSIYYKLNFVQLYLVLSTEDDSTCSSDELIKSYNIKKVVLFLKKKTIWFI